MIATPLHSPQTNYIYRSAATLTTAPQLRYIYCSTVTADRFFNGNKSLEENNPFLEKE